MDTIEIQCIDNGKSKTAEVLSKTDRFMKVVFVGTMMTLELQRKDLNRPYVGNKGGLQFTYAE